ncbi:hypothetical protein KFK09_008497 [Dendrobium nobile]|uniref:Secreted protein n=1 Tax=Dendrobium nobile TaxID=94219 RepID=A0A8T3BMW3_DENNO|nr:hypothetical protein KFK09_008497 [Dendrobium nobile]
MKKIILLLWVKACISLRRRAGQLASPVPLGSVTEKAKNTPAFRLLSQSLCSVRSPPDTKVAALSPVSVWFPSSRKEPKLLRLLFSHVTRNPSTCLTQPLLPIIPVRPVLGKPEFLLPSPSRPPT